MAAKAHTHHPARALVAGVVFLAMLLAAFSLWTAVPLSWLYIGSKVSETQFPSGGPYAVTGIGILLSIVVIAWLINRLNELYVRVTGTNRVVAMRPTWLKSMRDTGPAPSNVTVVEAVLMVSVMLAGLALTLWFFLLAGSPLPNQ